MTASAADPDYPCDEIDEIASVAADLLGFAWNEAVRYAEEVGDRHEFAEDLEGNLDLDKEDAWDTVSDLSGAFAALNAWRAARG